MNCPFCGLYPYEMVDVGVGHVPVAVNCCEFGNLLFDGRGSSKELREVIESAAEEVGKGPATEDELNRLHDKLRGVLDRKIA